MKQTFVRILPLCISVFVNFPSLYFSVNIPYIVSGIINFSTEMFWGYSVTWFMMHFKGLGYYLSIMHLVSLVHAYIPGISPDASISFK